MARVWITDIGTQVVYVDARSRVARMDLLKVSFRARDIVTWSTSRPRKRSFTEFYALKATLYGVITLSFL